MFAGEVESDRIAERRNRRIESPESEIGIGEEREERFGSDTERVLCCVNFGGRKELNATALFFLSFFLLLCNVFTILTFLTPNFLDKKMK